ncbi:MAG: signal peptidase II [Firmicutes bacterium]|nr:signal peptidase II [Bacillota bacterium]
MRRLAIGIIAILVFVSDRIVGHLVATTMVPGQSIAVLPPLFSITYILNTGAAFSLLPGATWLFSLVGAVVVVGMVIYIARLQHPRTLLVIGLGLLAGGTLGNLWDRLILGEVIDYLRLPDWPIFNIADSAIVVGMALIIWEFWRKEKEKTRRGSQDSSS